MRLAFVWVTFAFLAAGCGSSVQSAASAGGGTVGAGGDSATGGGNPISGTGGATSQDGTGGGNGQSGGASTIGTSSSGKPSVGGAVSYSGTFPAGTTVKEMAKLTVAGKARDVLVYRPASAGANAPLFILYHGTGGEPYSFMDEVSGASLADANGFIVALPKANRPQQGPADVDHWEAVTYDSGWNLADTNPNTNDDVLLTRAIIDAASKAYAINRKRVYTGGMSNGGFFSPMVALLLPNEIAGFSEQSGGAIRCANRGQNGAQWIAKGTSCAAIAKESGYPACSGPLKPVPVPTSGRIPRGFLAHRNADPIVSVAWTCHLAEAMGSNATTQISAGTMHATLPTHLEDAWKALSSTSLP